MALKSLKKKYDQLLKVFEEVGVTLSESQKETLDTFMLDFQNKLVETRDAAIKTTKKLVEEKMEKEFKAVFESINEKHKKIYEKCTELEVEKSNAVLLEAVDSYLDSHVAEVLPKKEIVDYGRMQKLEQIQESLKGLLLVNDEAVEKKVEEVKAGLESKMVGESKELKKELDAAKAKLADNEKASKILESKYENLAKKVLIKEKTKNLPIVESKRVEEKLSKMSYDDIKKNFKTVLESVQEEIQGEKDEIQEEKNLEEAIAAIMEGDDASEKTGDNEDKETENNADGGDDVPAQPEASDEEEEGGVQVTESMMQCWIDNLARFTPKH